MLKSRSYLTDFALDCLVRPAADVDAVTDRMSGQGDGRFEDAAEFVVARQMRSPSASPSMTVTGISTGSPRYVSLTSNCRFSSGSTPASIRNGRGWSSACTTSGE